MWGDFAEKWKLRNEPNSRQRRVGQDLGNEVLLCKTNQISPTRSEGASTLWKKGYDEFDLPGAPEKQSEFRGPNQWILLEILRGIW